MRAFSSGIAGSWSSQAVTRQNLYPCSVSLCAHPFNCSDLTAFCLEPGRTELYPVTWTKAQSTHFLGLLLCFQHFDWCGSSLKCGDSYRIVQEPKKAGRQKEVTWGTMTMVQWVSAAKHGLPEFHPSVLHVEGAQRFLRAVLWPPQVHVCACTQTQTECTFKKT